MVPEVTRHLTASWCSQSVSFPPPLPLAPCPCRAASLDVMDPAHVSPPGNAPVCRMQAVPMPHRPQTSPGLGWVRGTCLLEVQETVIRSCPHAFPLLYAFPLTKISKARWAPGPSHDTILRGTGLKPSPRPTEPGGRRGRQPHRRGAMAVP